MVLEDVKNSVQSNVGNEHKFSMEESLKAFKIVVNGLYKFPIRAIAREISTNCIDANKKAGKDPMDFYVTLPSELSSTLVIEDRALGMDEETIYNIYTKLFKSTKDNSNLETGMFGLGSKTPFAYTSQFIIESATNGVKDVYSAYYNDNDEPCVTKLSSIPCNYNGLKLSIPVKAEDRKEFFKAFLTTSLGWKSLPHLENTSDFEEWLNYSYNYSELPALEAWANTVEDCNKGRYIYDSSRNLKVRALLSPFSIEMGSVVYPVLADSVDPETKEVLMYVSSDNYIIHANIGDVNITPNREDLLYDDRTIKFVADAVKNTFVTNVTIPSGTSLVEDYDYFRKNDYKLISSLTGLNATAKAIVEKLGAIKSNYDAKVKMFWSLFGANGMVTNPGCFSYHNENSPTGKVFITKITNKNDISAKELVQKLNSRKHYAYVDLSADDISHLKLKDDNSCFDNLYFVGRYRSYLKGHSTTEADWKNKGFMVFANPGFGKMLNTDPYFGLEEKEIIKNWAGLENTYNAKVVRTSVKDAFPKSEALFRVQSYNEPWAGGRFASLEDIEAVADNYDVVLYASQVSRQSERLFATELDSFKGTTGLTKVKYESEDMTDLYLKSLALDKKVLFVITTTPGVLRSAQLWNKPNFKYVFDYLIEALPNLLNKIIESNKGYKAFEYFWAFEGMSTEMKSRMEGMDKNSDFLKVMEMYNTEKAEKETASKISVSRFYYSNRVLNLAKWSKNYTDEFKTSTLNLADKANSKTEDNSVKVDYDALLSEAYPLYEMFKDKVCCSWDNKSGWSRYTSGERYGLKWVDYVKLVDASKVAA